MLFNGQFHRTEMACNRKYTGTGDSAVLEGYECLEITWKLRTKAAGNVSGIRTKVKLTQGSIFPLFLYPEGVRWDRQSLLKPTGLPANWCII